MIFFKKTFQFKCMKIILHYAIHDYNVIFFQKKLGVTNFIF